MSRERLLYTRVAKARLQAFPAELRLHLETHLENLASLVETMPERLPDFIEHSEDGFVTVVQDIRVVFTVDTSARTVFVHFVEVLPASTHRAKAYCAVGASGD